jgi:hypothetical protein
MAVRTSPEAEAELDDIWYYIATESSSIEVAERMLDAINDHFAGSPNILSSDAAAMT